jgi:hypothetical protein
MFASMVRSLGMHAKDHGKLSAQHIETLESAISGVHSITV